MQGEKQQPYFFNPGMTVEQLEDWLEQQKLHLSRYNRLVKEKQSLKNGSVIFLWKLNECLLVVLTES